MTRGQPSGGRSTSSRPVPGEEPIAVTFFWAGEESREEVESWDPDVDWPRFTSCAQVWIVQTYLRLRQAGYPVRISDRIPDDGLLIYHGEHSAALRRCGLRALRPALVPVRGDRRSALLADFQIHQNGRVSGRRQLSIPHWPQPGLVPRDVGRGSKIERIAFKGFAENLHPDLRAAEWGQRLRALGVNWVAEARESGHRERDLFTAWADFREVDLVLALRPSDHYLWKSKPASKLVNAWLAGVPALLGPEYAYRELRRSHLDYLEVSSAEEAQTAIERLIADPDLYSAMVANGLERAREYRTEELVRRWGELLYQRLPPRLAGWQARLSHSTALRLLRLVAWHPDLSDLVAYCHPSVVVAKALEAISFLSRRRRRAMARGLRGETR